MRATCPFCLAAYELPDMAQSARTLRCARCGRDWRLRPEPVVLPPDLPESGESEFDEIEGEDEEDDVDLDEAEFDLSEPLHAAPIAPPMSFRDKLAPSAASPRIDPVLRSDPAVAAGLVVTPDHERRAAVTGGGSGWVASAWLVTLLVWGGLIWAAWAFRHPIMVAWPPSARVYGLIAR